MRWPRASVITGAGSGLGLALATALSERGATVLGVVRRARSPLPPCARLVAIGWSWCWATSPSRASRIAIGAALAAWSAPLDLLINNAGAMASGRTLAELDPAEILGLVDLHCNGALRCTRAALPALRRAERAVVVNVSSRLASVTRVAGRRVRRACASLTPCASPRPH